MIAAAAAAAAWIMVGLIMTFHLRGLHTRCRLNADRYRRLKRLIRCLDLYVLKGFFFSFLSIFYGRSFSQKNTKERKKTSYLLQHSQQIHDHERFQTKSCPDKSADNRMM